MIIKKIKYQVAVAIVVIATAFCGCGTEDDKITGLETVDMNEDTKSVPDPKPEEKKESETIKVYVCGAVKNPDVYTLPADVRVIGAVNAAGGFAEDAGVDFINLAAGLGDGQKVYIPTNREIEEAFADGGDVYGSVVNITSYSPGINVSGSDDSADSTSGKVNINTANKETLMTLPGIGQSKADKIIAYREANGGFASIEDIMLIDGIKEGMFNKIRDSICVK